MEPYDEISAPELRGRLDGGAAAIILDIREPWEHELCAIPGAQLIPMEELQWRTDELPPGREIIVYCHHGVRAAAVVQWLRRQGIPAVNLRGGIDAWALEVDPAVRRY